MNYAFSLMSSNPDFDIETFSTGFRYDLGESTIFKFQYDKQERVNEKLNVFNGAISFIF